MLHAGTTRQQTHQASSNHCSSLRVGRRRPWDRGFGRVHAQHACAVVQPVDLDLARRLGPKPLEGPPLHGDTVAATHKTCSPGMQRIYVCTLRDCRSVTAHEIASSQNDRGVQVLTYW